MSAPEDRKVRVVLTAGARGHVVVAADLALELAARCPKAEIHFITSTFLGSHERLRAMGFDNVHLVDEPKTGDLPHQVGLTRSVRSFLQSLRLIRTLGPALLVSNGSGIALPAGLAAWLLGVDIMVLFPTASVAGSHRANRVLGLLATDILYTDNLVFGEKDITFVRRPFARARRLDFLITPEFLRVAGRACEPIPGFNRSLPTLLFTFGSTGSPEFSAAVVDMVARGLVRDVNLLLLERSAADLKRLVEGARASNPTVRLAVSAWEPMPRVLNAADLVVCRGGNTPLEAAFLGKAIVIIPEPSASKIAFAHALERRGAALCLMPDQVNPDSMAEVVSRVLRSDQERCRLQDAARALYQGRVDNGYREIAEMICRRITDRQGRGPAKHHTA